MFEGKSILVTGGTGSFGKEFIATMLQYHSPERLIVFSRDELKQAEMAQEPRFRGKESTALRFFIGDVRDRERLLRAFDGVDIIIHAAALKHVTTCEYNPFEAIKTNVLGSQNVIDAAIERNVSKVIVLSTDKACNPLNLYGATKLCSDKLFIAGNAYAGSRSTRFAVVRYGNVIGSSGSVIPLFLKARETGRLPITHPEMTRFAITLPQCVQFVIDALHRMEGAEIFVPKIPSMRIIDVARAIAPDCEFADVGIRPGEKLHEVMISEDDARNTLELENFYVIAPSVDWWKPKDKWTHNHGQALSHGFRYSSDTNQDWLTLEELQALIRPIEAQQASRP